MLHSHTKKLEIEKNKTKTPTSLCWKRCMTYKHIKSLLIISLLLEVRHCEFKHRDFRAKAKACKCVGRHVISEEMFCWREGGWVYICCPACPYSPSGSWTWISLSFISAEYKLTQLFSFTHCIYTNFYLMTPHVHTQESTSSLMCQLFYYGSLLHCTCKGFKALKDTFFWWSSLSLLNLIS